MEAPQVLPFTFDEIEAFLYAMAEEGNLIQRPTGDRCALFGAAGRGDHDAQAALAHAWLAEAADGNLTFIDATQGAEIYAQLAAVSLRPEHLKLCAVIKFMRAQRLLMGGAIDLGIQLEGQALMIMSKAADLNDAYAPELQRMSDAITAEGAAYARQVQSQRTH